MATIYYADDTVEHVSYRLWPVALVLFITMVYFAVDQEKKLRAEAVACQAKGGTFLHGKGIDPMCVKLEAIK
jgi:hypothetical protein